LSYFLGKLHRDISIGNVIIRLRDDGTSEGQLIDFDYAKSTTAQIDSMLAQEITEDSEDSEDPDESIDMLSVRPGHKQGFPADLERLLSHLLISHNAYRKDMYNYKPELKRRPVRSLIPLRYLNSPLF
jgi:thiamine kinase-like enzyme